MVPAVSSVWQPVEAGAGDRAPPQSTRARLASRSIRRVSAALHSSCMASTRARDVSGHGTAGGTGRPVQGCVEFAQLGAEPGQLGLKLTHSGGYDGHGSKKKGETSTLRDGRNSVVGQCGACLARF